MILTHARCGTPVGLTMKDQDATVWIYCSHCHDLVEEGQLELTSDLLETQQFSVDTKPLVHRES
jgi:hypothetical protein